MFLAVVVINTSLGKSLIKGNVEIILVFHHFLNVDSQWYPLNFVRGKENG